MLYPIFLAFSLIYICRADEDRNKMNVGTVLFTESDNSKDCWGTENIALLTSRMMLEDLLPSQDVLIIKDSSFITDIIDYFRLVLEVVRKLTYGKTKHIMLLALTDTLGGYLNRFVIPTAKHAYYAGYIDFDSMDRLYQLFDELKCFLRTNGHGWAQPITDFGRKMEPQPLPIQSPAPKTDPCKGLVVYEKSRNGKSSRSPCLIGIPMPFFDSKTRPTSIAIPFKTYSLRNLESKSASYVLVKFYMAATKCLAMRNADPSSMSDFNSNFYSWINTQVIPHLNDDKFYSAFGGVMRVEETLEKMGTQKISNKEMGNYNIMPEQQIKEFSKEETDEATKRKKSNFILVALLATIFIWFLLGSLFICYRIKAAKNRKDQCFCDKEMPKSSTTGSSKPSSKMSKISTKFFSSSGSSKKPSNTTTTMGRSKKTTTSSGRNTPDAGSYRSTGSDVSVLSGQSGGSGRASLGSGGSKRTASTLGSPKSGSSQSSRQRGGSEESPGGSVFSQGSKNSKKTAPSKKSSKGGSSGIRSKLPSLRGAAPARQKPMYPASCACHTSMTGKYRMTSSSEEQLKKKEKVEPLVFGYELETSEESSPRDPNEEIDYGEMSK